MAIPQPTAFITNVNRKPSTGTNPARLKTRRPISTAPMAETLFEPRARRALSPRRKKTARRPNTLTMNPATASARAMGMPMRMKLSRAAKKTSIVKTSMATIPVPRAGQKCFRISPAAKAMGLGTRAAPITATMSQRKMRTSLTTTMMGMSEREKAPLKRWPSRNSLSPSSRVWK